jgi:hypothetical protein
VTTPNGIATSAGNFSVASGQTTTATRFEDTDDLTIIYTAGSDAINWVHGNTYQNWSARTGSYSRSAGGRANFTFTGTAATWIGFCSIHAGIARVYIDGSLLATVDLYSPTDQVAGPVFRADNLPQGTHTLTVESTAAMNPKAVENYVVVDAFDVEPATTPAVDADATRVEETAGTYSGGWQTDTSQPWSGGSAQTTNAAGAQASFTVTGTVVSWVGFRGPQGGIATVQLDGAFQATIDTYNPRPILATLYWATDLAPGRHTLTIVSTGTKNTAATDTLIAVDAIDSRKRFEDQDSALVYTGGWIVNADRFYSGTSANMGAGTAALSATAGDHVQFTFTGTAVTWIPWVGPRCGMADVSIDGSFVGRVDLYASADQLQVPYYTIQGLSSGPHTLRIDVTGLRNSAASQAWVAIDAFDVTPPATVPSITRLQETDPALTYNAGWTQTYDVLASGEKMTSSPSVGATATLTFSGTGVRWLGLRKTPNSSPAYTTGMASVSVDGGAPVVVDTRATQPEHQAALFIAAGLAAGSHSLTIQVVGPNNEPTGTQVAPVFVDAFEIF